MNSAAVWQALERLASEELAARLAARRGIRAQRPGPTCEVFPSVACRLHNVRSALWHAAADAERLLSKSWSSVVPADVRLILLAPCADIALTWGASVQLNGSNVIRIAWAETSAVLPQAWVASAIGLRVLPPRLQAVVPEFFAHYARGMKDAWSAADDPPRGDWWNASREIAQGHAALVTALLMVLASDFVQTRSDKTARKHLLESVRTNPHQGAAIADWMEAHAEQLYGSLKRPSSVPRPRELSREPSERNGALPAAFSATDGAPNSGFDASPATGRVAAMVTDDPTHWIEIELVGDDGQPIPFEAYRLRLPDGRVVDGRLDSTGFARHVGLAAAGTCQVCFLALDRDAWVPLGTAAARAG